MGLTTLNVQRKLNILQETLIDSCVCMSLYLISRTRSFIESGIVDGRAAILHAATKSSSEGNEVKPPAEITFVNP